jgi:hypothetical protein
MARISDVMRPMGRITPGMMSLLAAKAKDTKKRAQKRRRRHEKPLVLAHDEARDVGRDQPMKPMVPTKLTAKAVRSDVVKITMRRTAPTLTPRLMAFASSSVMAVSFQAFLPRSSTHRISARGDDGELFHVALSRLPKSRTPGFAVRLVGHVLQEHGQRAEQEVGRHAEEHDGVFADAPAQRKG